MSAFLKSNDNVLLANGTTMADVSWNYHRKPDHGFEQRDHELPGRAICFEGDGSFQVTCQALSDTIRYQLHVTVIIVNNAGHSYERWLNGMMAEYNDVPARRYAEAASSFGAQGGQADRRVAYLRIVT